MCWEGFEYDCDLRVLSQSTLVDMNVGDAVIGGVKVIQADILSFQLVLA